MKKGDERKNHILACAQRLFEQKGYENTSIQDILDELKCSKGGFYHYFDSKLALLEALTAQRTLAERDDLTRAVTACEGDAVERLNLLFARGLPWREDNMDFAGLILRVGYAQGSLQIRECVKRALMDNARPLLGEIIAQGARQAAVAYNRSRPVENGAAPAGVVTALDPAGLSRQPRQEIRRMVRSGKTVTF